MKPNRNYRTSLDEFPVFLSIADVMELTQLSRKTIDREIHAGRLPAAKIGGSYRISKTEFTKWFSQQERLQQRQIASLFS